MAYDGIVISNVINDIKTECLGGRVVKIQQPAANSLYSRLITTGTYYGACVLYASQEAFGKWSSDRY